VLWRNLNLANLEQLHNLVLSRSLSRVLWLNINPDNPESSHNRNPVNRAS
jgi:hypothetical protein